MQATGLSPLPPESPSLEIGAGALGRPRGMEWGGRREEGLGAELELRRSGYKLKQGENIRP